RGSVDRVELGLAQAHLAVLAQGARPSLGDGYQEPHMALARLPKAEDDSRRNHIVSAIEDRNEPCTDCVIRNGGCGAGLCHPQAAVLIEQGLRAPDSQKWEYSRTGPETFGALATQNREIGSRRPAARSKPAVSGLFSSFVGNLVGRGLAGWGGRD